MPTVGVQLNAVRPVGGTPPTMLKAATIMPVFIAGGAHVAQDGQPPYQTRAPGQKRGLKFSSLQASIADRLGRQHAMHVFGIKRGCAAER